MVPGVPDVLADAIEKVVDSEGLKTMGIEQYIVSEQSSFFYPGKGWCDIACRGIHDIIMGLGHEWTNRFKVHNGQYFPETRCWRCLRSWIVWSTTLWVVTVPHRIVTRARAFRNGSSMS